jgi:hypothetical protein
MDVIGIFEIYIRQHNPAWPSWLVGQQAQSLYSLHKVAVLASRDKAKIVEQIVLATESLRICQGVKTYSNVQYEQFASLDNYDDILVGLNTVFQAKHQGVIQYLTNAETRLHVHTGTIFREGIPFFKHIVKHWPGFSIILSLLVYIKDSHPDMISEFVTACWHLCTWPGASINDAIKARQLLEEISSLVICSDTSGISALHHHFWNLCGFKFHEEGGKQQYDYDINWNKLLKSLIYQDISYKCTKSIEYIVMQMILSGVEQRIAKQIEARCCVATVIHSQSLYRPIQMHDIKVGKYGVLSDMYDWLTQLFPCTTDLMHSIHEAISGFTVYREGDRWPWLNAIKHFCRASENSNISQDEIVIMGRSVPAWTTLVPAVFDAMIEVYNVCQCRSCRPTTTLGQNNCKLEDFITLVYRHLIYTVASQFCNVTRWYNTNKPLCSVEIELLQALRNKDPINLVNILQVIGFAKGLEPPRVVVGNFLVGCSIGGTTILPTDLLDTTERYLSIKDTFKEMRGQIAGAVNAEGWLVSYRCKKHRTYAGACTSYTELAPDCVMMASLRPLYSRNGASCIHRHLAAAQKWEALVPLSEYGQLAKNKALCRGDDVKWGTVAASDIFKDGKIIGDTTQVIVLGLHNDGVAQAATVPLLSAIGVCEIQGSRSLAEAVDEVASAPGYRYVID